MMGLVTVTAAGHRLADRLTRAWPDETRRHEGPVRDQICEAWVNSDVVVCFLATGATVRLVAPLLDDKHTDPGVVCVDEGGRFAVALCGGHHGGANEAATRIAALLGARPVVTTATDASGLSPLDTFGADLGFRLDNAAAVARASRAVLDGAGVEVVADTVWPVPPVPGVPPVPDASPVLGVPPVPDGDSPDVPAGSDVSDAVSDEATPGVSDETVPTVPDGAASGVPDVLDDVPGEVAPTVPDVSGEVVPDGAASPGAAGAAPPVRLTVSDRRAAAGDLVYRPPSLVIGVGASRGATAEAVRAAVDGALDAGGLSPLAVRAMATVDLKQDEPGIVAVAAERGWPLAVFPPADLAAEDVPNPSEVVRRAVGTPSVAEAAALRAARLAGRGAALVVPKQITPTVTAAVARLVPRGRLTVIGIGPGDEGLRTPRATAALRRASTVVGLDQYVAQVRHLLGPGTRVVASGLGAESRRAADAVALATAGHAVALIGSGDAGIYAMASPALELAGHDVDVDVVPGVTAALAAAALLGAPLGHDHAYLSLSDLHTPWETIAGRLRAVAAADLVACLYNPRSRARTAQFDEALAIFARHRRPDTPVGVVRNATRPGEQVRVTTLAGLAADPTTVDMRTIVLIGATRTRIVAGRMVTPREYRWLS